MVGHEIAVFRIVGLGTFATQENFGAALRGIVNIRFNFVPMRGISHRTGHGGHIHSITVAQFFGGGRKFFGKAIAIVQGIMNVKPAGGRTDLSRIKKDRYLFFCRRV